METIVELTDKVNKEFLKSPEHERRRLRHGGLASTKAKSGFAKVYDELFLPYRETANKVLEIGVSYGGSIKVWGDYFTKAEIHGADSQRRHGPFEYKRFYFHRIFLPDDLPKLVSVSKNWDIVIDDASHVWSHQIDTFKALFPLVVPGGLYICEDVETSYNPKRNDGGPSFIEFAKSLIDGSVWREVIIKGVIPPGNPYNIEYVSFRHNMVVFKKG